MRVNRKRDAGRHFPVFAPRGAQRVEIQRRQQLNTVLYHLLGPAPERGVLGVMLYRLPVMIINGEDMLPGNLVDRFVARCSGPAGDDIRARNRRAIRHKRNRVAGCSTVR